MLRYEHPSRHVTQSKIACSTNDIEKNSCTAASKKKMFQSYFIGALQNPCKTATIQWLIFYETPFLHQDLFKVFFPWMVCHHKRHNFAFSLLCTSQIEASTSPPGQPPGICIFCKIFVQIPPSRGQKAVQMPHHRSIPGDQMPQPPGNFSVAFIMLRKLCM